MAAAVQPDDLEKAATRLAAVLGDEGMMVGGLLGALLSMPLMATAKVVGRYIYCQLLDLPPWPPDEPVESEDGEEQESEIMPGRTSSGSAG